MRASLILILALGACGSSGDDDGAAADARVAADGGPDGGGTAADAGAVDASNAPYAFVVTGGVRYDLGDLQPMIFGDVAYGLYASTSPCNDAACRQLQINFAIDAAPGPHTCADGNYYRVYLTEGSGVGAETWSSTSGNASCAFTIVRAGSASGELVTVRGLTATLDHDTLAEQRTITDGEFQAPLP